MLSQAFCLCLLALIPSADEKKPNVYPRAELLIEVAELVKPEVAKQLRILDARTKEKYQAGHVPGAVWVDQFTWSKAFGDGKDRAAWGKRLGDLGIAADTRVVIYDDTSSREASRIWWILRYWDIRDVRLLNGGWTAWLAAGGTKDKEEPKIAAVEVKLTPRAERLATKELMLDLVKGKQTQIIDARSRAEHCGEEKTAKRNGAIPSAVHLEWSDVIDAKSQRFKGPEELTKLFRDAGIDPSKPAVTYCQSGGRSAVMAFTLELMGAKEVRNYYRSWAEWGNAEDTPIEKPKPKK